MTNEELHSDLDKFKDYLLANGVKVTAMIVTFKQDAETITTISGDVALALAQYMASEVGCVLKWKAK